MHTKGNYQVKKWDEKVLETIEVSKKTAHASVELEYTGDFEGKAKSELLMVYTAFDPADVHKANAIYTGYLTLTGKIKDKTGSFVLIDSGLYGGGAAKSTLKIVDGSGTGDFSKISGGGTYLADQNGCVWNLEVSF